MDEQKKQGKVKKAKRKKGKGNDQKRKGKTKEVPIAIVAKGKKQLEGGSISRKNGEDLNHI